MPSPWSADQVLALAPDASSAAAGRRQALPAPWSQTGSSEEPAALWGLCRGSGKEPYQAVVDLGGSDGPAYRCSCPSRKFPCKHALGLLLLWSGGAVPAGAVPDWAATWLANRAERPERAEREPAGAAARTTTAASARRAQQRASRVEAGVSELDDWLSDQVRTGLAGLDGAGYAPFDTVAARMVDAQAPGLAARLRRLPGAAAGGEGWAGRVLEELAALRLVTAAHRRLDDLPGGLAACVGRELGQPVARDDVLASPPVRDAWQVLALRDSDEQGLSTRRVWLHGTRTARTALVLSFAPRGGTLDASLVPGTVVEADLHLYPGASPLRALVGERFGPDRALSADDPWPARGLADAARAFAAAVAADPWTTAWPVLVTALTAAPPAGAGPWTGHDADGQRVVLLERGIDLWRLLAVTGGHPSAVLAERSADGLRVLAVRDGHRLVAP